MELHSLKGGRGSKEFYYICPGGWLHESTTSDTISWTDIDKPDSGLIALANLMIPIRVS